MNCVPATRDPLDPFGTIFVNCSSLRRTCSTRHLGHSSLITVDRSLRTIRKNLYQERLANLLDEVVYNVPGTSCKLQLLEEDVSAYWHQERLESYLTKMLQRIRNVLQVTYRRCYKVAGNGY